MEWCLINILKINVNYIYERALPTWRNERSQDLYELRGGRFMWCLSFMLLSWMFNLPLCLDDMIL